MRTRVVGHKARPHLGSLGVDCDEVTRQRVREQEICAAAATDDDAGGGRTGGAESIEREAKREYGAELWLAQIGLQRHRDAELLVEGDAHLGWRPGLSTVGGGQVMVLIMVVVREAPRRPHL